MKKYLLIGAGCVLVALAVFAQATGQLPWLDYAGLHIGSSASDKVGFYGATPVARQAIGLTLTNGATTAECVTKLQSIHTALINLGLCKTNAP